MRYFWTLYYLRLKAALLAPAMLSCALFFLALTAFFAWLLPDDAPIALTVGVLPRGEIAQDALALLEHNGDYTVRAYPDEQALRAGVLSGELHCGYGISDEWETELPVTVYYTEASYLRPLLDQLVLSAYFEAKLPRMTREYLQRKGMAGDAAALLEKQRETAKTMEVELRAVGKQAPMPSAVSQSVQPLLYAVVVSLFFAVTVLETLLAPGERARRQLRLTGHPAASATAPVLAVTTLHLLVLLAAQGLLCLLLPRAAYPLAARLSLLPLLAVVSVLPAAAAGALRRHAGLVAAAVPLWLIVSVFCSGALADPAQFPAGLGALRFVSAGWYALGWLGLF